MGISIEFVRKRLEEIKNRGRSKYSEVNIYIVLYIGALCEILEESVLEIRNAEDPERIEEIISLLKYLEREYPESQGVISETVELIKYKLRKQMEKIIEERLKRRGVTKKTSLTSSILKNRFSRIKKKIKEAKKI